MNDGKSPFRSSIKYLHKGLDLGVSRGLDEVDLSQDEIDLLILLILLANGGRIAAQMTLGQGDVPIGVTLASEYSDKLQNSYLVFGDDTGKKIFKVLA